MTKDKFWEVIDNARAIVPALEAKPLRESLYKQLLKLSPDELVGFDCAWQEYRSIANSPQLIAAACIINGGTSDDRFDYFKNWLILQGEYAFRQALKDPDALAEFKIPFDDTEWEDCGYLTSLAFVGRALPTYLLHEAPPEEQNFPMVMEMIAAAEVHEDDDNYQSPLDILFERLEMREPDSIACKQYRIFKQAAGKTAKSILVSVGVRLAAFNLPSIAKLTMTDELHLQELGERKIALFCCIPDSDKSLNYLVGMIYTQLIQTLYRQADRVHKGRLPVPVHCLMDEYANLSLPKDTFLSALATMRSRAIFCSIIVQNMAQLKAMYKDDWESLVGLCDEFLYLGGTEKETYKYVSELLGKETISTTSYNQSKGRSGSYSINHQQSGRDLMTPDEVRLLDNSKCILFIRGERPVVDFKYNLLKHPNIRCTEDGGAAPYNYTAADNALDDLPCAPENYELLDMDDFLPAEAAEMKPTIQRIRRPK